MGAERVEWYGGEIWGRLFERSGVRLSKEFRKNFKKSRHLITGEQLENGKGVLYMARLRVYFRFWLLVAM